MPYTPTQWSTGDVITAAKLNKIEQGISANEGAGGVLVEYDSETGYINKNYNQLKDIFTSGGSAYIIYDGSAVVGRSATKWSDEVVSADFVRYELSHIGVTVGSGGSTSKKSGDGETREVDPEVVYYASFQETVNWSNMSFSANSPTDEMSSTSDGGGSVAS